MFKRIVLAYDGSEHSQRARDVAVELALKFGAALDIVEVVTHSHASEAIAAFARAEQAGDPDQVELAADAAGNLAPIAKGARSKGVKEVNVVSLRGDPAEEVLAYVKTSDANLIVLGRRGLGRVGGLVLGSVSAKIAGDADCPVLTVK